MASVIKIDKSGLTSSIEQMVTKVDELSSTISGTSGVLKSIPNHSEFSGLQDAASKIANSLDNISVDFRVLNTNIDNYASSVVKIDEESFKEAKTTETSTVAPDLVWRTADNPASTGIRPFELSNNTGASAGRPTYGYTATPGGTIVNLDFNDQHVPFRPVDTSGVIPGQEYNYEEIEKMLDKKEDAVTVTLPPGLGAIHTYMGWQCITAPSSNQYKLREAAGMKFDEEGFAKIGDRYVIATTTTFGQVGDFVDVVQEDGTVIKCVIGDIKNQDDPGCNKWGHNDGHCVVEFVVDKKSWYGSNKSPNGLHPEWNQNITKIVNKGNFFDLIKTPEAQMDFKSELENVTGNEINKPEIEDTDIPDDVTTGDPITLEANPNLGDTIANAMNDNNDGGTVAQLGNSISDGTPVATPYSKNGLEHVAIEGDKLTMLPTTDI